MLGGAWREPRADTIGPTSLRGTRMNAKSARPLLAFLLVCVCALPACAQSFDCQNYGGYSACQMPNGSNMTCWHYAGNSSCQVEHPNGFVSRSQSSGDGQGGGVVPLIAWMIQRHSEAVTNKSVENASATVQLTIKHSMHLLDLSTLAQRALGHICRPIKRLKWTSSPEI